MKGKKKLLGTLRRCWAAALSGLVLWGLGGETLLERGGDFLQSGELAELVLSAQLGRAAEQEASGAETAAALLSVSLGGEGQVETAAESLPLTEPAPETAPPTVTNTLHTQRVELEEKAPVTVDPAVISIKNQSGLEVDPEAVAALACAPDLSGSPQILIMHTHGSEAYTPEGEDVYEESDSYRTADNNYNVVRVGEEIAESLRQQGYTVLHDTTLYDYPSYTGSYGRALEGIGRWLEEYPSISMVLDVHRDALISDTGAASKVLTTLNGEKTAQLMLVVGTDGGGLWHPDWKSNLSFAMRVQQAMVDVEPTLCRAIDLRSSRFNQHMTSCSLLVEVGSCGNTLQEALRGARAFGEALGRAMR